MRSKGCAVKYAWIDTQRKQFDLTQMCAVLDVSLSGYRAWRRGGTPNRKWLTGAQMLALIRAIDAELTDSRHGLPVADNLLARNFTPTAPNQVWTSDITYLWTDEGWLYLAIVLDLFNREVVGWSLKPRMTADIVTDALTMAWFRWTPAPGLMHHSDRGSQYASGAFQDKLAEYGMTCSMSRKGNCWDNAPTMSWFNSFKNERVHGLRYTTRSDMTAASFEYIEVFYNRKRLHSTLGYKSPVQFLQDWISLSFPLFFVFQRVGFMLPVFHHVEC